MDTELVLRMYNVHPYFSLRNLGKKSVCYTQQNTVIYRKNKGQEELTR